MARLMPAAAQHFRAYGDLCNTDCLKDLAAARQCRFVKSARRDREKLFESFPCFRVKGFEGVHPEMTELE